MAGTDPTLLFEFCTEPSKEQNVQLKNGNATDSTSSDTESLSSQKHDTVESVKLSDQNVQSMKFSAQNSSVSTLELPKCNSAEEETNKILERAGSEISGSSDVFTNKDLIEENKRLRDEIQRLRHMSVYSTCSKSINTQEVLKIIFRNLDVARKYKSVVVNSLGKLAPDGDTQFDISEDGELCLTVSEIVAASTEESQEEDDEPPLFTLDNTPVSAQKKFVVPAYEQKFDTLLQTSSDDIPQKGKKKSCPPKNTCFNCLGSHMLTECSLPRNNMNITKNRRSFLMQRGGTPKSGRYHDEEDSRFSQFLPGRMSKGLRKALDLDEDQLPPYIYRMRSLGYPPGWLEEARIKHSGIVLFDSTGNAVADPEDEDGEIVVEGARDKYDVKKIIEFPGFNVRPESGTLDETDYYRSPQMDTCQSKETMLHTLKPNAMTAYKRKRLSLLQKSTSSPCELKEADMEVEEIAPEPIPVEEFEDNCRFIPPLPKETPPRAPPPPPASTDSESEVCEIVNLGSPFSTGPSSQSSSRAPSPSLSDLETKKKLLLAELDSGGSSTKEEANESPSTPIRSFGVVKTVEYGTPIFNSVSSYTALPDPVKFSKDICDVINFENLPDSTGKYEKMVGLIGKVRTVVTRIQQDDK